MFSTVTKIQIIFVLVAICAAFYVYSKCKEIDFIQNRINMMSSQLQDLQSCKQNMCQASSPVVKAAVKNVVKREGSQGSQVTPVDASSSKHVVETVDIQIPTSAYDDEDEESICSFEIKNILKSITSFADDVCLTREPPVVIIKEEPENVVAKHEENVKNNENEDEDDEEEEDDQVENVANMTDEDLAKLRVDELREIQRNHDVDTKGTRPVLLDKVKRLREKMSNNNNTSE